MQQNTTLTTNSKVVFFVIHLYSYDFNVSLFRQQNVFSNFP